MPAVLYEIWQRSKNVLICIFLKLCTNVTLVTLSIYKKVSSTVQPPFWAVESQRNYIYMWFVYVLSLAAPSGG